ncbi:MAG: hypothetical protein Q7T86_03185 [Hyphomicrobiaceae bacterium]|nr:hypothetical protein [Hyphomicrobiaceae bacterium]
MTKVEQEVSAALSKYEEQRLRAGAPDSVHARRGVVQVVIEQRVSPNELQDYLISQVGKRTPKVEDEAEEAPKPAKKAKKKADTEAEEAV